MRIAAIGLERDGRWQAGAALRPDRLALGTRRRDVSFESRPVTAQWRIRISDEWVHVELWTHPVGWEVRLLWNGELARSCAYDDAAEAVQDMELIKARLEEWNRERWAREPRWG